MTTLRLLLFAAATYTLTTVQAVIQDDYSSGWGCTQGACNAAMLSNACNRAPQEEAPNEFKFGYLSPLTGGYAEDEITTNVGFLCALDKVNQGTLKFKPVYGDTEASTSGATEAALCVQQHNITAILGAGISAAAFGAATVGNIFKIPLLSPTASAITLGDDSQFPFFARIFPSDKDQALALAGLCRSLDWLRVAIVSESSDPSAEGIAGEFRNAADDPRYDEIKVATTQTFASSDSDNDLRVLLQVIKQSGVRVVILSGGSKALDVLRVAETLGMLEEGWAWIGTDGFMNSASQYSGLLGTYPFYDEASPAFADLQTCFDGYKSEFDLLGDAPSVFTAYAYDAMLLFADLVERVGAERMADHDAVVTQWRSASITGITGDPVELSATGEREAADSFRVVNYVDGVRQTYATYNTKLETITRTDYGESQGATFFGGAKTAPVDFIYACDPEGDFNRTISECTPTRLVQYEPNSAISERYCTPPDDKFIDCDYLTFGNGSVAIGIVVVSIGLFITVSMMLYTVAHWNHKIILLGQKRFLLLLQVGATIAQVSVFAMLGDPSPVMCAMQSALLSLGVTLMFATLILKSWRVARIVLDKTMKSIRLTDTMLFRRLAGVLAALVAILAFIMIFDNPMPTDVIVIVDVETSESFPFVQCSSSEYLSVLIFFIAGMMIYGCYIAFQIRHVKDTLAESKWIFLSVYNSTFCGVVALGVIMGIGVSPSAGFVVAALATMVASTGNVLFIMVPKVALITTGSWAENSRFRSSLSRNQTIDLAPYGSSRSGWRNTTGDRDSGPPV